MVVTANMTGYSVYLGLATSLDTLCAQAYGSGKKHLVGVQLQRMICFLLCVSVPIAILWYNGGRILQMIVPEKETARLAGTYLRVIIFGMPGYVTFESSKRFVQAQGIFDATLYCLLFCAPLNAIMNYTFVWVCFSSF
jgi:multidrug resistance protein, MATE family